MSKTVEEWRPVVGYEGLYEVSDWGRVKNQKNGFMKNHLNGGYNRVHLSKNNIQKFYYVHRLVAKAFIPNVNNHDFINHKDEDKTNNNVDNLEWCTREYNNNYGTRNKKVAKANSKHVYQYSLDGELIAIWPSVKEVAKECGFCKESISKCCNSKLKKHKGYIWKYVE